jgi:hypothetical protein
MVPVSFKLDVNLISRLAQDVPPAQILLPIKKEKVRNTLLMPIFDS